MVEMIEKFDKTKGAKNTATLFVGVPVIMTLLMRMFDAIDSHDYIAVGMYGALLFGLWLGFVYALPRVKKTKEE